MRTLRDLPNKTKAAVLMLVMGAEISGEVVKHLTDQEIETMAFEVARLERVSPDVREQVIDEFYELAIAQEYIAEGGIQNARAVLESAFGSDRASAILNKILSNMQVVPFDFLKKADPAQVMSFIQDEHPQTIALVLSYMPVVSAAQILKILKKLNNKSMDSYFFDYFVNYIFPPFILLTGLVGNLCGFIVMRRKELTNLGPRSMYSYLFASDTLYLIQIIFQYLEYSYDIYLINASDTFCKIYQYFCFSLCPISCFILCYISFDRYISITYPSRRFILRKEKSQLIFYLIIFIFNSIYYIPIAFESAVINIDVSY